MIAVGETFRSEKEFVSGFLVELSASTVAKGHPCNVEVGILGVLDPLGPGGALEAVGGPVPSILRLANVELAVKAECNYRVSAVRPCSVHDDLVEAVESHNCQVVTTLNEGRIDVDFLGCPLFHRVLHHLI